MSQQQAGTLARKQWAPTEEQLAVVSALRDHGGSLMVKSYAGCTKTSTLELAAPAVRLSSLALAFNKKIAKELEGRLPSNYTVKTFNGLGHGVISKGLAGKRLELDTTKLGKLVTSVARDRDIRLSSEQWDWLRRSVSLAMQSGLVPQGYGGQPLLADTPENWLEIALQAGVNDEEDWEFLADLAKEILEESIKEVQRGRISFDDQIYYSVCLCDPRTWPKYPLLMVDEAQDLSPLNHRMLELCSRAETRLIAVGDPLQAIYAFRGADSQSMANLRALRAASSWLDRSLTLTFRCPKVVVARQQLHAKGFRAAAGNAEGEFWSAQEGKGWRWDELPSGPLAVLCRNNAPLLGLAFKLIRRGIGVMMLGRDIHKGLEALVKKVSGGNDDLPIEAFAAKLLDWQQREIGLAIANRRSPEFIERIEDQGEALRASAESSDAHNAGALTAVLRKLFSRDSGLVVLSSIHKAKGLEWDNVLHLDPQRIPSRFAARLGGSALEQEWNLKYVCETRARRWLGEAKLEEME